MLYAAQKLACSFVTSGLQSNKAEDGTRETREFEGTRIWGLHAKLRFIFVCGQYQQGKGLVHLQTADREPLEVQP